MTEIKFDTESAAGTPVDSYISNAVSKQPTLHTEYDVKAWQVRSVKFEHLDITSEKPPYQVIITVDLLVNDTTGMIEINVPYEHIEDIVDCEALLDVVRQMIAEDAESDDESD